MNSYKLRNFVPGDIPQISALQRSYIRLNPGSVIKPAEVYLYPGFENGKNVICAFDEKDCLRGYVPLYPRIPEESSRLGITIWALIIVDPNLESPLFLLEILWEQLISRVKSIMASHPQRKCQIVFEYTPGEQKSIDYVCSKGSLYSESHYDMSRNLSSEINLAVLPADLQIRYSRLETESEKMAYIEAKNRAFPEAPMDLAELRFFLKNVLGESGTTVNAFCGNNLVGSVSGYWLNEEIKKTGIKVGYTEEIFVDTAWRGRGIASSLIGNTLVFLKEHGLEKARLGVRAKNEKALGLYQRSGYVITKESRWYIFDLF